MVKVTPGCTMELKTHTIDPDTNTVDDDSEAIHYEWNWTMNELFPTYHLKEFSDTVQDLKNTTNVSLDFLKKAVHLHAGLNTRLENKLADHWDDIFKSVDSYLDAQGKSVEDYIKDIKNAEVKYEENTAHPNTILYVIIAVCVAGLLFFVFKLFCTSSHSRKPLFPSYRMREWTNRRRHLDPIGTKLMRIVFNSRECSFLL